MVLKMTMTMTADLTANLVLYRSTRAGATRLAARIWPLVEALRSSRLWLPREAGLQHLARSIFGNAGYDACMNYDSPAEFAEALRDDLDKAWPEIEGLPESMPLGGVEHYVLRPFFNDTPFLVEARIGSLRACSLEELAPLNVTPFEESPQGPVVGLSDEELVALIVLHRSATLAIVNTIRYLSTALTYTASALKRIDDIKREVSVVVEPTVTVRLSALTAALALSGVEPPAAYFSSDWDSKCRLTDLAPNSELAVFLRSC